LTHATVLAVTDEVREVAAALEGQISYPTAPSATAVLQCFVSKLRGEPYVADVPLQQLVTSESLSYWSEVFGDPSLRAEWVAGLRHYQVPVPRVRPQEDGTLGILLVWIHPDQHETLIIDTPLEVLGRMAYLSRNDAGDWRVEGNLRGV
jgi:hypothetical protein